MNVVTLGKELIYKKEKYKGITLMKNIYNYLHTKECLNRMDKLTIEFQPRWRKMDVARMLAHFSLFQDIERGNSRREVGWELIGQFVTANLLLSNGGSNLQAP